MHSTSSYTQCSSGNVVPHFKWHVNCSWFSSVRKDTKYSNVASVFTYKTQAQTGTGNGNRWTALYHVEALILHLNENVAGTYCSHCSGPGPCTCPCPVWRVHHAHIVCNSWRRAKTVADPQIIINTDFITLLTYPFHNRVLHYQALLCVEIKVGISSFARLHEWNCTMTDLPNHSENRTDYRSLRQWHQNRQVSV